MPLPGPPLPIQEPFPVAGPIPQSLTMGRMRSGSLMEGYVSDAWTSRNVLLGTVVPTSGRSTIIVHDLSCHPRRSIRATFLCSPAAVIPIPREKRARQSLGVEHDETVRDSSILLTRVDIRRSVEAAHKSVCTGLKAMPRTPLLARPAMQLGVTRLPGQRQISTLMRPSSFRLVCDSWRWLPDPGSVSSLPN